MHPSVRLSREFCQQGHAGVQDALHVLAEALEHADTVEEECLLRQERISVHAEAGDPRKGVPDADQMIAVRPHAASGYFAKASLMCTLKVSVTVSPVSNCETRVILIHAPWAAHVAACRPLHWKETRL